MDKKESFGDFSEKIVLMALFNVPSSVQRVPEIESSLIRKSNCYKQFVKEIAFLRRGYSQRGRSNSLLRNSSITLCFINMLIKGSNKNYVTPSDILPFFRVCVCEHHRSRRESEEVVSVYQLFIKIFICGITDFLYVSFGRGVSSIKRILWFLSRNLNRCLLHIYLLIKDDKL